MSNEARRTAPESDLDAFLGDVRNKLDNGLVPLEIHNDEAVYDAEVDRIFGNGWLFVGHTDEIPEPGDYVSRTVGDDPFVLVRDDDGHVRVFFNSCRHRGAKVCRSEKGNASHFRCPYHAWTYDNSGDVVGIPRVNEGYRHLDPQTKSLHEPPNVAEYEGMVFLSMDPDAPPLEEYLGDYTWYLDGVFELFDWEVVGDPHRWEVDANWKIPAENTADAYHVYITHKSAMEANISPTYADEDISNESLAFTDLGGHLFNLHLIERRDSLLEEMAHLERVSENQYEIFTRTSVLVGTIFPNFTFILLTSYNYGGKESVPSLCLRQHKPIGPDRFEYVVWILVPEGLSEAQKQRSYEIGMGIHGDSGTFVADDIAVWDGITEAGGSTFAQKNDLSLDYTMGQDGDSEVKESWPGPGTAYTAGEMTDVNQLEFFEDWLSMMERGTLDRGR